RRRNTRCYRDWSSDVCSSDLETPTLCFLETLTPVNVCRVCVVELEGSRTLVPACSRKVEAGMVIRTDSERVRLSRRVVLEFLASDRKSGAYGRGLDVTVVRGF